MLVKTECAEGLWKDQILDLYHLRWEAAMKFYQDLAHLFQHVTLSFSIAVKCFILTVEEVMFLTK